MCVEAWCVVDRAQSELKYPSVGEWKNDLVHASAGRLFSDVKKSSIKL
jgi:hypothetical protein